MNAASSEAKNETAPTRSSGSCVRLIACSSRVNSNQPSSPCGPASVPFVRVRLGAIELTVTPESPTSVASARTKPITAPLLVV